MKKRIQRWGSSLRNSDTLLEVICKALGKEIRENETSYKVKERIRMIKKQESRYRSTGERSVEGKVKNDFDNTR